MHADLANPSSPSDLYSHNQPDSPRSFDSCPLGPLPAASTESDRDEDSSSSSSEGTSDAPSAVQSTVSSVSNSAGSPVRTHFHSAENVTLAPQKSGQHLDMEADQRGDFSQHDALISTPVGPSSTGGWELQQDQILSRPGLRRSSSDLSSAAASTSELTTASETTRPTSSQSHSAFSALGPRISFVGPVRPGDRPAPKPFPPPLRASIRNRSRSSSAIAGSVRRISQSASNPSMGFDSGSTSDSGSTPTISASESRPTTLSVSHATTNSEAAERRLAQQDKMDGVVHPHPDSKLPRGGRGGRGGAGAADRPTPKRTKRPQTAPAEGSSFSLQSFRSFVSGAKQSLRRGSSQVEEPDETLKRSIGIAESPQADPVELPAPQYLTATRPRAIAQSPASELEEYLRDEHDEYDDGQNDYYDMAGPSRESSSPAFRAYPLPSRSDSGSRGMGNGRHLSNDSREEEEFEDLVERNAGPASDGQDEEMPITSRPHAFGKLGSTSQTQNEASTQAEGASPLPLDQNDEARASQARSLTWGGESGSLTSRRGSNLDPPLPGGIFDRRPSRQEIPSGSSSLRSYSVPVGSSRRASTAISEAEGMVCPTPPLAFPPPPRPFYKGTLLLVRDNVVLDDDEKEKEAVVNEDDEASGDEGGKEVSTEEEVSTVQARADTGAVDSKDDRGEDDTAKGNEIDAHRGISDASTGPDQSESNGAQLGSSDGAKPSLTSEAQPASDSTSQQQKALPITPKRGKRRPQTAPGGLKSISSDPPQVVITSPDAPPSQLDLSSPSFSSQRRNPGPNQSKAGGTTDSYSPLERVDEHSDETQPSQTVLWSGEAHPHFEVRSGGQLREKVRLKTITGFVRRLFSARSSYDAGVGTVDAVLGKGGVAQLEAADEDESEKGWKRGMRTSRKSRVGSGSAPGKPQSPSASKPTKQGSKDVGVERPTIIRIVSRDDPLARQRTNSLRNRVGSPGIYSKPNTTRSPSRMSTQTASNPLSPMSLPSSDEVPRYFPNEGSSSPLPLSLQRTRTSDAAVSSPQSEFGARCDTPTSILSTSTSVVRQGTGERRDSLARRETPWEDVDSFRRMQKKLQAQQQQQQRPKNVRMGSSVRRPATMERSQDVPSFGSPQSGRDGMTQGVETSTTGSALGVGMGGEEKKRVGRRPRTMEGRVEGLAQTQKSAWSGSMEERWGGQGGGETGAEFFL
ncbi:hypothetical protein CF326_g2728 [Tilletia indica]|nr:hypothetical protein CF326_g2728 [Tilletia indica]